VERENQELKLIIDSSPIIIFYKDKEGRFLRINKTFAEALKMPQEKLIGKTVFDIYSSDIAKGMMNDDQEVFKSGRPKLNIVEQYESASGIRWVQTDKVPIFDKDGVLLGLVGFAQDITERKQAEEALKKSEERFKTLYENAPVLIDGFDENGRCILWNRECEKVFGWTMDEISTHDVPLALFYPDPDVRKEVIDTVTLKPEKIFREWHPQTRDGKELVTLWANFKLPDGVIINIGYDITARKQAEEELRKYQSRLEEMVQKRTAELTEVNEELRNEIAGRKRADEALKDSKEKLRVQKDALEQKNIALREIMEQIGADKQRIKEDVLANVDKVLLPILRKLRVKATRMERRHIDVLENSLEELASSFGRTLADVLVRLTPREVEICGMIRSRLTSKEMSKMLHLSRRSVETHRHNIRKKLGLANRKVNLTSYLQIH